MTYYILEGHEPKPCQDVIEWAKAFQTADRIIKQDHFVESDIRVSTVFLGLDHGFNGKILLFETMIFGGEHDEWQDRYSTWDEAIEGHKKAVELVTQTIEP